MRREKGKRKDSSGTRLDKLSKGAFVKVGSMAWDVWIHACSHILLGCGYGIKNLCAREQTTYPQKCDTRYTLGNPH